MTAPFQHSELEPSYKKLNNLHGVGRVKQDSRRSAPRTDVYGRKSAKQAMAEDMYYNNRSA